MNVPELVCPTDGKSLVQDESALSCSNGHRFVVDRGIPRILLSGTAYVDTFGEQWNQYQLTQLDSYTGTTISEERLRRCFGVGLWETLQHGNTVRILETGCGAGRFTEVLLRQPAAAVTSTDLSSAVDANQINCPQSDRHRIIQCDIHALPFARAAFDIVVCLGVIQHTPDPEKTIAALYDQVKPGGWLIIDHYAPSLSHYTKISALALRPLLKRMSPTAGTRATELLTKIFFPLHRAARNHRSIQVLLSRVSPLLTYFQMYPQLSDRQQYEWALLDTHDHLTDYYKHFRTVAQIKSDLEALRAEDIWAARGGNGVEARCHKPLNA